jgi:hypothetical protein
MPMHDWTRVEAGIFHAHHHEWISEISRALNRGLLPASSYALPEQAAAGYGSDVLTLQDQRTNEEEPNGGVATATTLQTRPQTRFMAEIDTPLYPRLKSAIAVRHVSDDRLVAWVEIVFPGNKAGQRPFQEFINKACELLERRIHLLIVDPFPPGPRDPNGVHAAIWQEFQGDSLQLPADKPLTLVAYECDQTTRAYIEPVAVGDALPMMPVFLEPNGCVMVPVEATYQTAYAVLPRRWQRVLEALP